MTIHRPYGAPTAPRPAEGGPLAADLARATTFAFPTAEALCAAGAGAQPGEFYPRYGHLAGRRFVARIAAGADGAGSCASGHAARHAGLRRGRAVEVCKDAVVFASTGTAV